jgi:WD40 repeat protein
MWKLPELDVDLYQSLDASPQQHLFIGHSDSVIDIKVHPMASLLGSISLDGTLKLWDIMESKSIKSTIRHDSVPNCFDWLGFESDQIAVAYGKGLIKVYDSSTNQAVFSFSDDMDKLKMAHHYTTGSLLTGNQDGSITCFDYKTGIIID